MNMHPSHSTFVQASPRLHPDNMTSLSRDWVRTARRIPCPEIRHQVELMAAMARALTENPKNLIAARKLRIASAALHDEASDHSDRHDISSWQRDIVHNIARQAFKLAVHRDPPPRVPMTPHQVAIHTASIMARYEE